MKKVTLVIFTFLTTLFFAQTPGTITGKVLDKEFDKAPLPFANVFIKNTTIGTNTEFDGSYEIIIAPGNYTLVFSFIGYQTIEVSNIVVKSGEVVTVDKIMNASKGVSLDEVLITGSTKRESEKALLTEQKKAVAIKQSIGSEEITRKGVSNAASAVTKISGISKEGSSNVYVRGLGDRYLNTTFNELPIPSNKIDKKNIDLSLFTTDVIQNVSVSKAYSSNLYADFAAGNVNITSKEFTGDSFIDVSISSGVNTNSVGKNFKKSDGTGYFGFYGRYNHNPFAVILSHGVDPINAQEPVNMGINLTAGKSIAIGNEGKLSFFITGAFDNEYLFSEGTEADYTNVLKKSFPNVDRYSYSTNTTIMGSALYRINSYNKLKFNSLFINNSTDEVGYYGTEGLGSNRDAQLDTDAGFYQMNVQFNQNLIFVNQVTGSHTINDSLELDWGIGYNNVYSHEPDRKRITLEQYYFQLDNDLLTQASFYTNNSFDNQRYFEKIIDEEFTSRAEINYSLKNNVKFNFGLNQRTKERDFNNIRYGYKNIDNGVPIDQNNLNAIFNYQNFENGIYQTDVFRAINPQGTGGTFLGPTNLPGKFENTYQGKLDVVAGYTSAEILINKKWLVVPSLRAEYFSQKINYDVVNLIYNPGQASVTEKIYLPAINTKYSLTDKINLRFSYSNSVSFPEFKEMAPYVYEGVTSRIGGNPDLLGHQSTVNYVNVKNVSYSNINNFDVKFEWFISPEEIFSIAGFAKEIKNPINLVVANDATGTQRYFRTGNKAKIYGLEIEAKKQLLIKNEEPVLTAGFNMSYMHTKQDLFPTIQGTYSTAFNKETEELQGASPLLINADINYTPILTNGKVKPLINLVANYFSDRIFALGSGQLGNKIEKGFTTIDFIWKNEISENSELNFSAKNILNPDIKIIREISKTNQVLLESYNKGVSVSLQYKYKF